ncbi:MAG TPA: M20/M25/M40 family metallo-hydrolase, partial [Ilumatobacteraceae bacterium]|nr:M20/M25/M40 family metallo-hydrolase [Ilumatobacteraceae bacterium]
GRGAGVADQPAPPISNNELSRRIDEFLVANGAALRINDAGREHGQIIAFNNRTFDIAKAVPTVVMRNEDYGRIARILADGTPVELELTIVNTVYPEGRTSYNVVAEIPGSDKKDEVVMLGGHLDSWQSATGATDNAIGCAVMMEAARILKALGVQPRRTIRVALWSGEEQGLLGSKAYVKEHFADRETMQLKPEHGKVSAYFNVDNGTGAIRGVYLQGNEAVVPIFTSWMQPFENLGMKTLTLQNTGGTDHLSFDAVGIPGFQFIQDPVEYDTRTHHSNMDVYDRLQASDMMKNAVIVASFVYNAANRDEKLPRKPLPKPTPPAGRSTSQP